MYHYGNDFYIIYKKMVKKPKTDITELYDDYEISTNLIKQRVDREDYTHGWKNNKNGDLKIKNVWNHRKERK